MKRKIGLVLAHHNTNYGALLQSYATQQVVEDMGFETEIIDYKAFRYRRGIKFDWGLIPYFWESYKASRRKKSITSPITDDIYRNNKSERIKRWHEFEDEYLHNIVKYHGYPALTKRAAELDAILIGSDQMWLPGVSFGYYQSLQFAKNTRRISYATSLGVSEYPSYCFNSSRKMFKSIDFLSVREEQGKNIIQNICKGIPVEVVCDPTYLLSKEKWQERIPVTKMSDDRYVLCYLLGNAKQQLQTAKEFAEKNGLKLFSILSDESVIDGGTTVPDKIITGASVEDFINYIRGAELIFTDSFHGLAFSVINEKQFFIFYRKREDSTTHRNSRIDNILNMWQLQDRLITSESMTTTESIDYEKVTGLVKAKREESMKFLNKALTF